ncbi:MAG: hypothetical protein ACREH8_07965, partial [Opitutaceae bacterium]
AEASGPIGDRDGGSQSGWQLRRCVATNETMISTPRIIGFVLALAATTAAAPAEIPPAEATQNRQ